MSREEKTQIRSDIWDTPCPLCGEMFTERGLSIHMTRQHNASRSAFTEGYRTVTEGLSITLTRRELALLDVKPGDTLKISVENGRILITPEEK